MNVSATGESKQQSSYSKTQQNNNATDAATLSTPLSSTSRPVHVCVFPVNSLRAHTPPVTMKTITVYIEAVTACKCGFCRKIPVIIVHQKHNEKPKKYNFMDILVM